MRLADNCPVQQIKLEDIDTSAIENCRGRINPSTCVELAMTIKEQGLIQPVAVMENPGGTKPYALIAGFRRFTAHRINRAETIEAKVLPTMSMGQALIFNLMENLERQDLNMMQEARSVLTLQKLEGLNQRELATKLDKSPKWVQLRIWATEMPAAIQEDIEKGNIKQQDIEKLKSLKTDDQRYAYVKAAKSARARGEKPVNILKKTVKDITKAKRREKHDMNAMQDHIVESLGSGRVGKLPFAAQAMVMALGWAAGEKVSDIEIYKILSDIAKENGLYYEIPKEAREALVEV